MNLCQSDPRENIGTPSVYSLFRLQPDGSIVSFLLDYVPVTGIIPACEIVPDSKQIVLSTSSRLGIFISYDGMPVPDRFPLEWLVDRFFFVENSDSDFA